MLTKIHFCEECVLTAQAQSKNLPLFYVNLMLILFLGVPRHFQEKDQRSVHTIFFQHANFEKRREPSSWRDAPKTSQDALKTLLGRPQMALGPSEGQPLDRPRATLICKNQYNFNVCLKLYWFLHIKIALGPLVRTAGGNKNLQKTEGLANRCS